MLFDSHAHLDDGAFDPDRDALLHQLPQQGVKWLMNPGCSLESSRRASALAQAHPWIYAAVGSHPDAADEVDAAVLDAYRELCAENPKIRAIGEIGLDYRYEDVPRGVQLAAFRAQMALAQELKLPVIVHEREAHGDGMDVVRQFPAVTGVFHCYSGAPEMARELVQRGWYVGFTGVLTFRNARRAVETACAVPLERILVETDSPYLSPEPLRGRRNDPGRVRYVVQKLAQLRGLPPETVARVTAENACRLYGIPAQE